jgi:hypothetical protein
MWARLCWYLGHDNRPCPSSSRQPWSVPRLRGRGKQGEIARKVHFVSVLYDVDEGSSLVDVRLSHMQERRPRLGLPRLYPCSPRPRKRGTLHGCANLSSFRDFGLSGLRGLLVHRHQPLGRGTQIRLHDLGCRR